MDDFEKEMFKKLTETLSENQKCITRFCDMMDSVTKKLEVIYDGLDKFEKFAANTFGKLNDVSLCIDGLTGLIFEKKVISPEEYKDYVSVLYENHKKRIEEEAKKEQEHAEHHCNCKECNDK